jgi:tRNA A-37 threonylcarbamoyl transferase component Bud32
MITSEPSRKNMLTITLLDGKKLVMTTGSLWKSTYLPAVMSLLEAKALPEQTEIAASRNARALKLAIEGSPVFVKFFASRGIRDRWILRKSRSSRAVKGGVMLSSKGFNTPALIAQGDLIKRCMILDNFLITQWIEGYNIYTYIESVFKPSLTGKSLKEKHDFIRNIGQLIGRLHRTGIVHGDLRPGNILIQHSGGGPIYYFIDNERNIFFNNGIPDRLRLKNLVQMNMLLMPHINHSDRLRFFRAYLLENPELVPHERKWIRLISLKTRKRMSK